MEKTNSDTKLVDALGEYFAHDLVIKEAEQKTLALHLERVKKMADVQRVLLAPKGADGGFYPVLDLPWVDGWNYFRVEGLSYKFKFNEAEWKIEGIEAIRVYEFENPLPLKGSEMQERKRIQVFVGPERSGKTRKAREIAEGKNVVWVDGRQAEYLVKGHSTLLGDVTAETELIIIDDVPDEKLVNRVAACFFNEHINIHSQGRPMINVKTPEVIIICALEEFVPVDRSLIARAEVVKFDGKEVAHG